MINWSKKSLFNRPVVNENSGFKALRREIESFGPLRDCKSQSKKRDMSVSSGIVCLLFSSSPPAVIRSVIPVIINTVYASPLWTLAHICKKCFKTFPLLADSDPPSSIIFPVRSGFIITSLCDVLPYPIGFRSRHSMRFWRMESSFLCVHPQLVVFPFLMSPCLTSV